MNTNTLRSVFLKGHRKPLARHFVAVGLFFMASLSFLLLEVFAAGDVFFEAESGTRNGQIQVISDASASGGSALQFTSAVGTTTLPSPGTWVNRTSNLANMQSECGNLTLLSVVPNSNTIIAGVARRGLWASTNGGSSWSQLGTGAGSATINNRPNHISYDPANSSTFYEAGIYGDGIYKTTNGGQTFTRLGDISHIDYVSIDYTDPNRQTMVAGGHEQSQVVYKTTNGGQTWTNIGANLPSGSGFSSAPIIINSQTFVISAIQSWGGGETGMFRTTNGGSTWTKVSTIAATGTPPTVTSTGTIFWPTGGGLARSTDGGVTWTTVGNGNIQNGRVTELPDGRIVAANGNGRLVVTADGGNTWTEFGANMPYNINDRGVIYLPSDQSFFIWEWDCGNNVLPTAIMKLK